MDLKFRNLNANEIECRVNQINEKGLTLLLYKDARCDMNILDETVGAMNWQRKHDRDNANCTVSIYDSERNIWVSKEDVGIESNTHAEKGLASDSFKRACVNWGIGRELYTAPFIYIPASSCEIKMGNNGKWTTNTKFKVNNIAYDKNGNIVKLVIINNKREKVFEVNYENNK